MLLRRLQHGELLPMPQSRPMPAIGRNCHELRIRDADASWRIFYQLRPEAVVILGVLAKKGRATPLEVVQSCRRRLKRYEEE